MSEFTPPPTEIVLAGEVAASSRLERYLKKVQFTPEAENKIAEFNQKGDRESIFLGIGERRVPPPYQYDQERIKEVTEYAGRVLVRQIFDYYNGHPADFYRARAFKFLDDAGDMLSKAVIGAAGAKAGNRSDRDFRLDQPITEIGTVNGNRRKNELTCGFDTDILILDIENQIYRVAKAIENIGRGQFEAALYLITYLKNGPFQFGSDDLELLAGLTRVARYDKVNQTSINRLDEQLRKVGIMYNDEEYSYENDSPETTWWFYDGNFSKLEGSWIENIRKRSSERGVQ